MNLLQLVMLAHRRALLAASALSLVSAGLSVAVIAFIEARLLDRSAAIGGVVASLCGLLAMLFAVSTAAQLTMRRLGHRVILDLRRTLVKRVLDTDLEQLERLGPAKLLASLSADAGTISLALICLPTAIYGATVCLGAIGYLAWLSPKLFVPVALWIALTVGVAYRLLLRTERYFEGARDVEDQLQENYQGLIHGRKELALNRRRARLFYEAEFAPNAERARALGFAADAWNSVNDNFVNAMALGAIGLSFVVVHATGWASLSVAMTYGFTLLFVGAPLAGVVNAVPSLIGGSVALRKISALELPEYDAAFRDHGAGHVEDFRSLELRGAHYHYPGEDGPSFEIGPIDWTLTRGECVFIVGGNGSGKSTLARMLSGLCQPNRGQLALDGVAVSSANVAQLRGLFSAVFSDYHLFTQLLGRDADADSGTVAHWLERLQLAHKLQIADGRLQDVRFSAGQRKRLALLLSILEDRPLLLLDEWAADQDPAFRRFFYLELLPQLQAAGKTIVAITHDEHYFHVADRVLKLDGGRLIEQPPAEATRVFSQSVITS